MDVPLFPSHFNTIFLTQHLRRHRLCRHSQKSVVGDWLSHSLCHFYSLFSYSTRTKTHSPHIGEHVQLFATHHCSRHQHQHWHGHTLMAENCGHTLGFRRRCHSEPQPGSRGNSSQLTCREATRAILKRELIVWGRAS